MAERTGEDPQKAASASQQWSEGLLEGLHAEIDDLRVRIGAVGELLAYVAGRDLALEGRVRSRLMGEQRRSWPNQPPEPEVYVSLSKKLGPVAARVLESCLLDLEQLGPDDQGLSIGVSGGRSIKEMMACVTGGYGGNLWLVPLSGSRLPDDATISVNTIIGQFCGQRGRSEVKGLQLPLDPRARAAMFDVDYEKAVGTRLRKYYIQDRETREGSDPPPVHYAFTGVGSLDETSAIPRLETQLKIRRPPGTIGDMLDWPINKSGEVLGDSVEIRHHVVGVRPDELQLGRNRPTRGKARAATGRKKKEDTGNLKKVIVVAGSDGVTELKDEAILAAWRGGLFDVLVTDARTAKAMLADEG